MIIIRLVNLLYLIPIITGRANMLLTHRTILYLSSCACSSLMLLAPLAIFVLWFQIKDWLKLPLFETIIDFIACNLIHLDLVDHV